MRNTFVYESEKFSVIGNDNNLAFRKGNQVIMLDKEDALTFLVIFGILGGGVDDKDNVLEGGWNTYAKRYLHDGNVK